MKPLLIALVPLLPLTLCGCTEAPVQNPPGSSIVDEGTPSEGSGSKSAAPAGGSSTKTSPGGGSSALAGAGAGYKFAPADDSAEASVRAVIDGVSQGHPEVIWSALPPGYRNDVNEIVQTFGRNMDPQAWNQVLDLVSSLQSIVDTKSEFILNSQMMESAPDPEKIKSALPQIAGLLQSVIDIADLESLATFDGAKFLEGPGANLLTQVETISKLAPESKSPMDLAGAKVRTISSEGDTATLEVTRADGETKESQWVRVDGNWVPAEMAEDWDSSMEKARQGLAELPETMKQAAPQIQMFAGMAKGVLTPLTAAEDQEQFDSALQAAMGMGMGMMMQGGGGFGGPPAGFEDGPPSGFDSPGGFGDSDDFSDPGDEPTESEPEEETSPGNE